MISVLLGYNQGYDVVMETTTAPTAIRTIKNGKATITVTFPDGTTATASGARASRAEAAKIVKNSDTGKWELIGLRQELQVAQREALSAHQPREIWCGRTLVQVIEPNTTVAAIIVTEG